MSITRTLSILCMALSNLFMVAQASAADSGFIRPPQWAQPVGDKYNLNQMSPTLYRSALPDADALPLLEQLKIGTVINFLPESDASWLSTPDVKKVQLPYRTNHVDDADVLAALRAIKNAEGNGPVLMHCKHGSDRTGLMAAMYRVVVQGWSKEDALAEMTQGGFGESAHHKDGIRYMMKADIEKLRIALANGDCSTSPFATCNVQNWFRSASVDTH